MTSKLLASTTVSLLMATAAFAQTDTDTADTLDMAGAQDQGQSMIMEWQDPVADAFFADDSRTTVLSEDEIRSNWNLLSDAQQQQVRQDCGVMSAAAGSVGGAASGGIDDVDEFDVTGAADADAEFETDTTAEAETDIGVDTETTASTDADTEFETGADGAADADMAAGADVETDTEVGIDPDTTASTQAETDLDADVGVDAGTDMAADAELEADTDFDAGAAATATASISDICTVVETL